MRWLYAQLLLALVVIAPAACEPQQAAAAAPDVAGGGEGDVRSILAHITTFVTEGASSDQQAFDHLSAVCDEQSRPLEEKVQRASAKLGAIKAEIKQQQGVQQQSVVSGELKGSISSLKEKVSKLRARLESLDALHKAASDQWEEHEREIAGSLKMLSPFVREYDDRESTDPTRQAAPASAGGAAALIELRAVEKTSGAADGDSLLHAQQAAGPAGRRRPAVRFRRVESALADAPQAAETPAAAPVAGGVAQAQQQKPLLSVSNANTELLQALQAIEQRLLAGRPSQESFRSDRAGVSPQADQAEAQLQELESKRDTLVETNRNATATIAQLEGQRAAAQAQSEQLEAQLAKATATCGLYLREFKERKEDRATIMRQVEKLKAQAMAVVNNILEVKVGDGAAAGDCCPCADGCAAESLCQHCLQ